jgi:glycine/D-amino acid oxidase-like deaminating enzyme
MKLGDTVVGASYSVHDGHVNPLALLRALHAGVRTFGGDYYAGHSVFDIRQRANQFIIRSWAALRVITPDKMPIYEASESSPQVFAIALHSGVTLASLHAGKLVSWIMDGREPAGFQNFHSRRFHV